MVLGLPFLRFVLSREFDVGAPRPDATFAARVANPATTGYRKQRFITANRTMSAFSDHKDELEHYQTMMGPHRGALAVTLDLLTNALVLVGQHGVYCHTNRDADVPVMDIRIIQGEIGKAKELIQSVMENIRAERDA